VLSAVSPAIAGAEVRNPEGHLVQMDDVTWNHVLDQHVEMSEYLAETMAAIKTPDHREPDPRAGRERFSAKEARSVGFGSSPSSAAARIVS
jgi:hypothetical protein